MSGATTLAGLFARLFDPERAEITPEAAECLLKVGFDQDDRDRIHELAEKNSRGELTPEEDREFENYIAAGDVLTILHLKARAALKDVQATTA
jgi:hypothetical protein